MIRPLSAVQRSKVKLSLFWMTAIGAILTVAAPALLPCPRSNNKIGYAASKDDEGADNMVFNNYATRHISAEELPELPKVCRTIMDKDPKR